ncbi:MAG TPA: hypothetical protein VHT27_08565 [Solirubrobacteraceae bacterium]|jgi:hypothetical protein|nr:hypothetical protein [Solirubrobacteraceae bacterium]
MSELLESIKGDLLDRRMLPLVGLVLVALVAAIGYALFAGSGGSSPSTPAGNTAVTVPHGIAVSEAQTSGSEAVAETTDGTKKQRQGTARNPFAELPSSVTGVKPAAATSSTSKTASATSTSSNTSSTTSSSPSSSGSKTESAATTETKSSGTSTGGSTKPSPKPKTVYDAALQFGSVPPGTAPGTAQLTPYAAVTRATPLPSSRERLIEFVGVTVTHTGVSASFAVDAEVILRGAANCLPSASQCQVLDLKEGRSEELEYLAPDGAITTYELRLLSIASHKASAATVSSVLRAQKKISSGLMAGGGALRAAGLRFSSLAGVIVFAPHPAKAARAHAALEHR